MKLKAIKPTVLGTFLVTILISTPVLATQPVNKEPPVSNPAPVSPSSAYAYAPGTFSFKPINANISSFTFGRRPDDSTIVAIGRNNSTTRYMPFSGDIDVYREPLSFGFAESDRNGFGYGIEFGYVLGWDTEIIGRAGFSTERPITRTLIGDRSFDFERRNSWGMALGARHYFNYESSWKPFVVAVSGFTVQGATNATINRHNPLQGPRYGRDVPIQRSTLLQQKTLFNIEVGGGIDYAFNKTWVLSYSMSLRYGQRGGKNTVSTPIDTAPFLSPAMPVTYKDKRPMWTVPITISLKIII